MPKKFLTGKDIAEFIEERHFRTIRSLKPKPKLAIVSVGDNEVSNIYIRVKKRYAEEVGAICEVFPVGLENLSEMLQSLSASPDVHGIILQLPVPGVSDPSEYIALISKEKDVDGLCVDSPFDTATPQAIMWLLAGFNIDLIGKRIVVVGQGRLVGLPLAKMLIASGLDVVTADEHTTDLKSVCLGADILISAVGVPKLITSDMVANGAIVIDAGTASEGGVVVGDVDDGVRGREDVIITPLKGGVGPLTVSALFENLLKAYTAQES